MEVLVFSLAGLVLLTVFWFLFFGGLRHFRSTDDKLKGVQAAQLLVERLQDDFDRICWSEQFPLEGAGQGGPESTSQVSFFAFRKENIPKTLQPAPVVEKVSYRFDRDSRRVYRNNEPLRFARFENLRFKLQSATTKDPMRPDVKPEDLTKDTLFYWVSAASDEKLERMDEASAKEGEEEDRRGITTLLGSVHLTAKGLEQQYPGWVENPPDRPREP